MKSLLAVCAAALLGGGAAQAQKINAAGATFPAPIYQKWFGEYHKTHPGVEINYQPVGSGAGIKQLTDGTVDFGASDMPMTDKQLADIKVKPLHFPTVLGAVVLTYNVPGVMGDLKLAPDVIADIYLGKISKWNDGRIAKDNPGVKLPGEDIVVVRRTDASGTTFVFTDYLSKVSPEWKSKVGASTSVSWPGQTLSGPQNAGVAGLVKQTPDSIGYVELAYAITNKMPYATVKNAAGAWVRPALESVTAAAAGAAKNMPADFRVSITDAAGKIAYPISTFTWMLIPSHIPDAAKAKAIKGFLQWMLTDGQKEVEALTYAPLPKEVAAKEMKQIAMVQ
ncbi:MAG TPA: phosphate ABC transporter substrate-binding protein PstS [Bryobacteraceae bacterium]|nr:phosphate ABC transporter substrate-binding protein PstS [Bryobacteraceae bacterium]